MKGCLSDHLQQKSYYCGTQLTARSSKYKFTVTIMSGVFD